MMTTAHDLTITFRASHIARLSVQPLPTGVRISRVRAFINPPPARGCRLNKSVLVFARRKGINHGQLEYPRCSVPHHRNGPAPGNALSRGGRAAVAYSAEPDSAGDAAHRIAKAAATRERETAVHDR